MEVTFEMGFVDFMIDISGVLQPLQEIVTVNGRLILAL